MKSTCSQSVFLTMAFAFFAVLVQGPALWAETAPRVGRAAASKYFSPASEERSESRVTNTDHYLALHLGKYMNSQAYEWSGRGKREDVGDISGGLTYRVGEWNGSMDLNLRVDFNQFKIDDQRPLKMSLLPLITFPEASSKFPLYFGFGVGVGVFFKQVEDESSISLDYQLVAGARFFNVYENTGFFIESGLKNHLHLLTSGQLNGTFLAFGALFTF
jgi:hypothetical protein